MWKWFMKTEIRITGYSFSPVSSLLPETPEMYGIYTSFPEVFFVQRAGKPAGNGLFGPCNKTGVHIRKRRSAETVNPVKVAAYRTLSAADHAGF